MSSATTSRPGRNLDGLVAVSKDSKIKPLGYVCWFSMPEEPVQISKLRREWLLAGLDPEPLPRDQKAADIFRRAMRAQEARVTNPDRTITQTDVVDVVNGEVEIVYQISRVVRDLEEKAVDYPRAMRVIFNKETDEVKYYVLGGVPRAECLPMMTEIDNYVEKYAKSVTGRKVRGIIRNYIKQDSDEGRGIVGLSGTSLRGQAGGVYFVLARHAEQVEALSEVLDRLFSEHRGYLHSVPLADGASERELIRRHHIASALEESKQAIEEVRKVLAYEDRTKAIRGNVIQVHWSKLRSLQRRAAAYNAALADESEEVDQAIELMRKQLKGLGGE